jgi:hypothetical protein
MGTSTSTVTNKNDLGLTPEEEQKRKDTILLTGEDPYENKSVSRDPVKNATTQTPQNPEDAMLATLVQGLKSNYEIDLKVSVNEKIVEPSFIKMISNNVKGDIIDYYARMFLDKILYDPDALKESIYKQLYMEVYDEEPPEKIEIEEIDENIIEDQAIDEVIEESKGETVDEKLKESVEDMFAFPDGKVYEATDLIPGKPTKSGKPTFKYSFRMFTALSIKIGSIIFLNLLF